MPLINELFIEEIKRFEGHLSPKENCRIIFSGIYGSGKTTFLENFFNINTVKYEVIRLFPVNYSVGSNEDIFQYIKYDIFLELLRKGVDLDSLDLNLEHKVALFVKNNWSKIAINLFKTASSLGKNMDFSLAYIEAMTNFFESQKKLLNKYIQENVTERYDDSAIVNDFMTELEAKGGSIFEASIINKIIEKKIEQLKKIEESGNKQTVLVIDDLDRIDPEHIFRILNVFAAHFDLTQQKDLNKFGFDKVILVCDIENIRSIFHYKYGSETNFNGFIDKFYSDDVFKFHIVDLICNKLLRITKQYQIQNIPADQRADFENENNIFHWLIKGFIKQNSLNLRSLTKFLDRTDSIVLPSKIAVGDTTFEPIKYHLLFHVIIINKLFGHSFSFLRAISKLEFSYLDEEGLRTEWIFNNFLYLATIDRHRFNDKLTSRYYIESTKAEIGFDLDRDHNFKTPMKNIAFLSLADSTEEARQKTITLNLVPLIYQAVNKLHKLDILK